MSYDFTYIAGRVGLIGSNTEKQDQKFNITVANVKWVEVRNIEALEEVDLFYVFELFNFRR